MGSLMVILLFSSVVLFTFPVNALMIISKHEHALFFRTKICGDFIHRLENFCNQF